MWKLKETQGALRMLNIKQRTEWYILLGWILAAYRNLPQVPLNTKNLFFKVTSYIER